MLSPLPTGEENCFNNIDGQEEKQRLLHQNNPNLEVPRRLHLLKAAVTAARRWGLDLASDDHQPVLRSEHGVSCPTRALGIL